MSLLGAPWRRSLAYSLPPTTNEDIENAYREAFNLIDKSGSGGISVDDLYQFIKHFKLPVTIKKENDFSYVMDR